MRHIQSDLLDEARLPANLTIQNIFDEYTKSSVGGATGEQYTTLMTDMRALHFVEEETLREKNPVGFWSAVPKRAKGLMVPTHFLGVCTAGVKIKARHDLAIARRGIRLKTSPFWGSGSGVEWDSRGGTLGGLWRRRWFGQDAPVWGGLDAGLNVVEPLDQLIRTT